jgi:hypothetical protein
VFLREAGLGECQRDGEEQPHEKGGTQPTWRAFDKPNNQWSQPTPLLENSAGIRQALPER